MIKVTQNSDSITFGVRVIPRSSKSGIVGEYDEALKVKISAPPVEGAANKELIKLLSKSFGVSKSAVRIISGESSKTKQVKIEGVRAEKLHKLIADS